MTSPQRLYSRQRPVPHRPNSGLNMELKNTALWCGPNKGVVLQTRYGLVLQPCACNHIKKDPKVVCAHVQRCLTYVIQQKLSRNDGPRPNDAALKTQKQPPYAPFSNNSLDRTRDCRASRTAVHRAQHGVSCAIEIKVGEKNKSRGRKAL